MIKPLMGTLDSWCYDEHYNVIWGYITNQPDINRFREGARIHTSSLITAPTDLMEGMIVETTNSRYKLGDKLVLKGESKIE